MLNFEFKIDFSKFEKGLQEKVERTESLAPAMKMIGADMVKEVQLNFRGEKTPDNVNWKKSQRALREGGKTLSDTGLLRKSISAKFNSSSATVGTNVVYAAIHQFGSGGLLTGTVNRGARTGAMYGSINKKTGVVKNKFVKKSKANLVFQVSIKASSSFIPARPFLGINYVMMRRYERAILNYLNHGKLIMR